MTSDLLPGKFLVGFDIYGFSNGTGVTDRTFLDDLVIDVGPSVAVPLPATLAVLGLGLAGVAFRARGRRAPRR